MTQGGVPEMESEFGWGVFQKWIPKSGEGRGVRNNTAHKSTVKPKNGP